MGFIISWWQLSCEIFLQILTSLELHSNSANRPGILLSHDGSLEVNLLMIFLELSLKKTSRMTKSDIWGWQHLGVPKYLLDEVRPGLGYVPTSKDVPIATSYAAAFHRVPIAVLGSPE